MNFAGKYTIGPYLYAYTERPAFGPTGARIGTVYTTYKQAKDGTFKKVGTHTDNSKIINEQKQTELF